MKPWNTKTRPDPTDSTPEEADAIKSEARLPGGGDVLDRAISVILEGNQELLGGTLADCKRMLAECAGQVNDLNAVLGEEEA